MSNEEKIKKYFEAANAIVINGMYLNSFSDTCNLTEDNLKKYNPGHLGTSMSINFILANLYYFLNSHNLKSQIVVGTGHAGISLITNLWLNGTLEQTNPNYQRNLEGLNNLIRDFGTKIRSEINPEYPTTIYDGGELGYSLATSYGYAINSEADIVPCIIGDGEAETGSLASSWYLPKILKTKSKVLPIINLNGLKMGSASILSRMSDEELQTHFQSLGYKVQIIDATDITPLSAIIKMQSSLKNTLNYEHPLIIFKSKKGYTLPSANNHSYEGDISVHKNPLSSNSLREKLNIIKAFLSNYDTEIFDSNRNILPMFNSFKIETPDNKRKELTKIVPTNSNPDTYLKEILETNGCLVFSPDEIFSNQFKESASFCIEMLNEPVLQALYQGYIRAGNMGYYISYEGFMPIISSMITQYYKYLYERTASKVGKSVHSLNYILTSTALENTYSHQNPDFVNSLLEKNDQFYNILYPKDQNNTVRAIESCQDTRNQINVITFSKRHTKIYQNLDSTNLSIETIIDSKNPEIILCATGDYMLDQALATSHQLLEENIPSKVIYVTKPQILNPSSKEALTDEEFDNFFTPDIPVVYLFTGYPSTIKSLLFDRHVNCQVLGYNDTPCAFGNFTNNAMSNGLSIHDIIKTCKDKISAKKLKLRR